MMLSSTLVMISFKWIKIMPTKPKQLSLKTLKGMVLSSHEQTRRSIVQSYLRGQFVRRSNRPMRVLSYEEMLASLSKHDANLPKKLADCEARYYAKRGQSVFSL